MQYIYRLLGAVLPTRLLKNWAKLKVNTFRYTVADYAPARRGVM